MCTRKRFFQSYISKKQTERKYVTSPWIGLVVISVFILTACQAAPVVESSPIESATIEQPTAVPTRVQTTAVPTKVPTETPLPTNKPTIIPTPRPLLGPEELATSIENVAGKWAFKMGGSANDLSILTLTLEGTTSLDAITGELAGMNGGRGEYWFEDGVMVWYSEDCSIPASAKPFTCTAQYKVYYALGENGVGSLRFIAIDDPHKDRRGEIHGKTLFPPVIE